MAVARIKPRLVNEFIAARSACGDNERTRDEQINNYIQECYRECAEIEDTSDLPLAETSRTSYGQRKKPWMYGESWTAAYEGRPPAKMSQDLSKHGFGD